MAQATRHSDYGSCVEGLIPELRAAHRSGVLRGVTETAIIRCSELEDGEQTKVLARIVHSGYRLRFDLALGLGRRPKGPAAVVRDYEESKRKDMESALGRIIRYVHDRGAYNQLRSELDAVAAFLHQPVNGRSGNA